MKTIKQARNDSWNLVCNQVLNHVGVPLLNQVANRVWDRIRNKINESD